MRVLGFVCLHLFAQALYGDGVDPQRVDLVNITSMEAGAFTIPATFSPAAVTDEEERVYKARVEGVILLTESIKGTALSEGQTYEQYARQFCPPAYQPKGELTFNAGRHISVDLGTGSLSSRAATRVALLRRPDDGTETMEVITTIRCSNNN